MGQLAIAGFEDRKRGPRAEECLPPEGGKGEETHSPLEVP